LVSHCSSLKVDIDRNIFGCETDIIYKSDIHNVRGLTKTVGEMYAEKCGDDIDPKNWMKNIHKIDRIDQIYVGLTEAMKKIEDKRTEAELIIKKYKSYNDYPKIGVIFQDFFSIIREKDDIQKIYSLICEQYKDVDIDYVVGPESRGFFGFGISCIGGYGFIPLRKKGKLPGNVKSITYQTEYSTDTIEAPDDIRAGSKVLVFDDLIATGGSLKASCDLLEQAGCIIVDCIVLREVQDLRSVAKNKLERNYTVLLQDL
jgi:adenine phosphoribosyltransferase